MPDVSGGSDGSRVRVITIAREYGSGGSQIAAMLAERLQWRVVDDPFITRIAESLRSTAEAVKLCDECVDPWFHHVLRAIWRGGFEGGLTGHNNEPPDADSVAELWHRVIGEAAEEGNCITVGRGGQCILKNRPNVFHAYIYGPIRERMERIREREEPGRDLAAAAADRDRRRNDYIRHYFAEDWRDPHLYHVMLNSKIGLDGAVDVILRAAGLD